MALSHDYSTINIVIYIIIIDSIIRSISVVNDIFGFLTKNLKTLHRVQNGEKEAETGAN